MAQPFDLGRLELTGEPSPIAESVGTAMNRGMFSIAGTSPLAYRMTQADVRLNWFDRSGKGFETPAVVRGSFPRFSSNGKRLVLVRVDPERGFGDLWLEDLASQMTTRLTSHPGFEWIPIWSPDGNRVVFASNREGTMDLYEKSVDGSELERMLLKSATRKLPTDWSRAAELVIFQQEDPANGWDLWALPMGRMSGERKPFPVLQSEFDEIDGALSPDGQWLYSARSTRRNMVAQSVAIAVRRESSPAGGDPRHRARRSGTVSHHRGRDWREGPEGDGETADARPRRSTAPAP